MADGDKRQRIESRPARLVLCLALAPTPSLRAPDGDPARILKSDAPDVLAQSPKSASAMRRRIAAAHAARGAAGVRAGLRARAGMGNAPRRETIEPLSLYLPDDGQAAPARRFAANRACGTGTVDPLGGRVGRLAAIRPEKLDGAGGAETGAARPAAIRALRLVEAGLHRVRRPGVVGADEGQRSGHGQRALADRAGGRLCLSAKPRRFASHPTTFLTGFGTDHRVIRPPDECTMS